MTDAVKKEELGPDEDVLEEGPGDGAEAEAGGMADDGVDVASDAAPEPAPGTGPSKPAEGDDALAALRSEFEALNDRHLRLAAEFNNFRRRSEQERLSAWARAQADLVGNFLDVLDDLHRVADLDLGNASVEGIMEGIDLVERKFVRMIEDAGVEMIDPVGQPFDPEMMEAMMRVPAESEQQQDTVAQVFQKGYSLKGILIRPARVSVHTQG